jgi:three-Cys-motif partner protein
LTEFFDAQRDQSRVKALIVQKYFTAWSTVILSQVKKKPPESGRLAYIDLFAGPGRYRDGAASTPILILQRAIADPDLRNRLVTYFNDADPGHCESLASEFSKIRDINQLRHKPHIENKQVGEEHVKDFEQQSLVPTLFFIDPWGYKGLSLGLINAVLRNWGSDVILFFNYNRINMGVGNQFVTHHMDALFGTERLTQLRNRLAGLKLTGLSPDERENVVIEGLSQSLIEMGGKYVLPFRFLDKNGARTSHHLIFVSKHHRGYVIMKQIMAKESSRIEQGVGSLEYSPADERFPTLFELNRPLDSLESHLLKRFANRTITRAMIFEEDDYGVGTRFTDANYRQALLSLVDKGKIQVNSTQPRRKNTLAEHLPILFPPDAPPR